MFVIQYENGSRLWDVPKTRLHGYLVNSENDIADVYEQATPVTKRVSKELREAFERGTLKNATPAARRFMTRA
jgi:CHASE3 domain sensor protein